MQKEKTSLKHFDILKVKKAYAEGKNITELLRAQKNVEDVTSDIIEDFGYNRSCL